jgi:REP element-mobilizing transposase RayT
MKHDPDKHHRRSIRLRGYDYAQGGGYFVTIVTRDRACLFGEIVDGEMRPNQFGRIVVDEWERSSKIRRELETDAFVLMPNHIHGIVIHSGGVGATGRSPLQSGPRRRSLGAFVGGFKSAITKRINESRETPGTPVWQRNYYEHIIRVENELDRIREYIANNPVQWEMDRENPLRTADRLTRETEPWEV